MPGVPVRMGRATSQIHFAPSARTVIGDRSRNSRRIVHAFQHAPNFDRDSPVPPVFSWLASDEEAISELIEVRGIGRWPAQMFLIFSLGHLDIFPHDDLIVRSSIRELYGLAELSDKQTSHEIAEPWSPYRSVATWYCWRLIDVKNDPAMDASKYPV